MKEKKKDNELLIETPEARRAAPAAKQRQASTLDKGASGQSEIRDLVLRRAYELYEERGRSDGGDMNDWLRAEAEVRASLGATDQGKSDAANRHPAAKRTGGRR